MFKIGEFSQLVRVSPRMLRHYEKCGLIAPAAIDPYTGYRQYAAAQISQISRIAALRDIGFSIDEIGEILPRYEAKRFLKERLREKARGLRETIEQDHARLNKLMLMSGELQKENTIMLYEVELKKLEAVKVLSLRGIIPQYNQESVLWEKLGGYIAQNGIACHSDGYSTYFDEAYMEANPDVEIAVPVDKLQQSRGEFVYQEYPAIELAATLRFSGPFDGGYDAAGEKLAKWLEENDYAFAGHLRGHVITSPDDEANPDKWLTELQVPVQKIG
jgi:DNA-binding transcriptional MerR regulator